MHPHSATGIHCYPIGITLVFFQAREGASTNDNGQHITQDCPSGAHMGREDVTSLSLLERVRLRDESSWFRLVQLYGPLVEYWCRRGGAHVEDSADLTQEVFAAVSQGMGQFERRGQGSFRAWMRGITRNKLLDYYRRAQRQAAAAGGSTAMQRLQEVPDPQAGSEEDADEASGLYRRALDLIRGEFEERTWQAFWLAAVEGRDAPAVAKEMGMSPVAVRIAKSRVLARLRAEAGDLVD
jgi:RNA polymerase sigma-70 factor (ECF subfamily)